MSFILHIGIAISLLMLGLLLFKKEKAHADFYFATWLLVFLLQLLFYEITIYRFPIRGAGAAIGFSLALVNMPILFFYLKTLMGRQLRWPEILSHLSPWMLYVGTLLGVQFQGKAAFVAVRGYLTLSPDSPTWLNYYAVPLAISAWVYCIWMLILLNQHKRTLSREFSYQEAISLNWIRYLVYAYLLLTLATMVLVFGATQWGFFDVDVVFSLVGAVISLLIFASGFMAFRQTHIFSSLDPMAVPSSAPLSPPPQESYAKSGLSPSQASSFLPQLAAYMDEERIFLDENLTLGALAEKLAIPTSHLSQIINQQLGKNFYDFVNEYRIQEAQQRLQDPFYDHYSILGIGLACGFKSKSSFNRAFKKFTDKTPSEFRRTKSQK